MISRAGGDEVLGGRRDEGGALRGEVFEETLDVGGALGQVRELQAFVELVVGDVAVDVGLLESLGGVLASFVEVVLEGARSRGVVGHGGLSVKFRGRRRESRGGIIRPARRR
jgi:hypothetical protein